ncbi:class II glutamine amidotransferase [Nocardia sp. NPDC052566]|uniref:class II glutamine amidotransferase n=1 Tax=Nocardia sp. NPDC052566 TaxID=3364330 RepID=UPI0037CC9907
MRSRESAPPNRTDTAEREGVSAAAPGDIVTPGSDDSARDGNPAAREGSADRALEGSPAARAAEGRTALGSGDPAAANLGSAAPDRLVASRYRNAAPIWTDPAVDEVLPQLESSAVLAAIRSATVGMPVERAACAPFIHGRWAFSHNGAVRDWRRTLTAASSDLDTAATLAGVTRLFETIHLLEAESATDSATVWVLLSKLLDAIAPDGIVDSPAAALRVLVAAILTHAPSSRLNFLLGDGETLWATTVHHSLSALITDDYAVLASEPYDDDRRWQLIPDRQLVIARPGRLLIEPLSQQPKGQSL